MEQEIFGTIKEILKNDAGINTDLISLDTSFDELELDSLSGLLLIHDLEDKYDVNIENEDAFKVATVREAIQTITQLIDKK